MEYLVLRKVGDDGTAGDWTPQTIAHVDGDDDEARAEACKQGYTGDGRYRAVPWPEAEGYEFDLGPAGPPTAIPAAS